MIIFELGREAVTGDWRKLRNVERKICIVQKIVLRLLKK
jgi:hypothetical protein